MNYVFHFGPDGIQPVEGFGEAKQPVIVGETGWQDAFQVV